MKKTLILSFSIGLLLINPSCSTDNTSVINEKNSAEKLELNRSLTVEIEGMVCEKGCGSSIRKALKETGAVGNCSFDFVDERLLNTAIIEFDKDKISADKIIGIITSINEKQFSVAKSSTATIEVKMNIKESEISESKNVEASKINVSETNFEMPNLLKLFSRLIKQD